MNDLHKYWFQVSICQTRKIPFVIIFVAEFSEKH